MFLHLFIIIFFIVIILVAYGATVRAAMLKNAPEYKNIILRDVVTIPLGVRSLVPYNEKYEKNSSDEEDSSDDNDKIDNVMQTENTVATAIDKDLTIVVPKIDTGKVSDNNDDDDDYDAIVATKKPRYEHNKAAKKPQYSEIMKRLIDKDIQIPFDSKTISLYAGAVNNITDILEGEYILAKKNKVLGTIMFNRDDDMKEKYKKTNVCMQVDENGIINVTIKKPNSNEIIKSLDISGSVPWDERTKTSMIEQHNLFIQNAIEYKTT